MNLKYTIILFFNHEHPYIAKDMLLKEDAMEDQTKILKKFLKFIY